MPGLFPVPGAESHGELAARCIISGRWKRELGQNAGICERMKSFARWVKSPDGSFHPIQDSTGRWRWQPVRWGAPPPPLSTCYEPSRMILAGSIRPMREAGTKLANPVNAVRTPTRRTMVTGSYKVIP